MERCRHVNRVRPLVKTPPPPISTLPLPPLVPFPPPLWRPFLPTGLDRSSSRLEVPRQPVRHPDHGLLRVRWVLRVRRGDDHLPKRLLAPGVPLPVLPGPADQRAHHAPVFFARALAPHHRVLQVGFLKSCVFRMEEG